MKQLATTVLAIFLTVFGTPSQAAIIVYDLFFSDGNGNSLSGTITTDGTIGVIEEANIVAWSFVATGSQVFSENSAIAGSTVNFNGSTVLMATSRTLSFDFEDASSYSRVIFSNPPSATSNTAVRFFDKSWEPYGAYGVEWQVQGNLGIFVVPGSDIIAIAPVPEPETYAMLLAGLGLIGTAARRRK